MLSLLASIYGGTVRRFKVQQKSFVEWVINDQKTLLRTIVPLFKEYPPLTTRMRLQLGELRDCRCREQSRGSQHAREEEHARKPDEEREEGGLVTRPSRGEGQDMGASHPPPVRLASLATPDRTHPSFALTNHSPAMAANPQDDAERVCLITV